MTGRKVLYILLALLLAVPAVPAVSAAQDGAVATELWCNFPGEVIEAGDTAVFDIVVKNQEEAGTCLLNYWTYRGTDGWKIRFEDSDREVYRMLIPAGETKSVRLVVETAGHAAVGEYPIRVGIGKGTIWVYVRITKTHSGETGTLEATVVDKEGNVVKGADIGIYDRATLIEGMLSTAEGKVSIGAPMGTYTVRVTKPGYRKWEKKDVEVRIGQTTNLGIVPLEKENFFAEIRVKSPSKVVAIGATPQYEMTLKNAGRNDDTYALSVQGLAEQWYARFRESKDAAEEVSEIYIRSGEEKTLFLDLIPPYSVGVGEYNVTVLIDSSARQYEENLTLRLRGSYDMRTYAKSYRHEINRGDTLAFDMTVSNAGTGGTLTNIGINMSTPEGWRVTVDPASVASLDPGERATVHVTVVPPANIVAGEYKVVAVVKSDQAEREDEYRVVVKEQSYVAVLGLLVMAGVAAGLWYMFRKYGRR
ncbi:PEGA domain-containing protein [Methanoculleus sp. Wushi-C6]|uniref:PEGA domain-containing protein n=1 Tax=Methanoculleus caldifontis TaxID=2651577 RepID=A0ABU3X3H4_9EURY|nr:PEGA domain-containing protein [Methanoculleus sp. Wushi-C6]